LFQTGKNGPYMCIAQRAGAIGRVHVKQLPKGRNRHYSYYSYYGGNCKPPTEPVGRIGVRS
jgi:hypothetical protein